MGFNINIFYMLPLATLQLELLIYII